MKPSSLGAGQFVYLPVKGMHRQICVYEMVHTLNCTLMYRVVVKTRLPCYQRFHYNTATGEFHRLLPRLLLSIISINYTDFHNCLGKHGLQTPVGKSRLTAPFLPQPPTSQNQPLTIELIESNRKL